MLAIYTIYFLPLQPVMLQIYATSGLRHPKLAQLVAYQGIWLALAAVACEPVLAFPPIRWANATNLIKVALAGQVTIDILVVRDAHPDHNIATPIHIVLLQPGLPSTF